MNRRGIADEPRPGGPGGNVVILLRSERLDFIGASFDGGGFAVRIGVRVMGLHQAGVIEEKLVPACRAELPLFEKHAYLWRRPIDVVGINLDDDRHLLRGVTLEDDVFDGELFCADARALFYGAVDGLAIDTFLLGLLNGGKKARVRPRIGSAHFGGDGDFPNKFGRRAALLEAGDQPLGMEPLSSHGAMLTNCRRRFNRSLLARKLIAPFGLIRRARQRINGRRMPRHKLSLSQALPAFGRWLGTCGFVLIAGHAAAQSLDQTRREFALGHYDAVIKTAQNRVDRGDYQDDWRILLVKALLTVGHYSEAHSNAVAGLADSSGSLELRMLVRETDLIQNDASGARRQLVEMKYLIERRFGAFENDDGVALGKALLLLGVEPRLVLENCFRRAQRMDPPSREAFVASGQLALDKHDFALADDTFRAALKKFPDDPDLEAGLARAFESGDRKEMLKALHAALAINPRHIPSLLLLADHLIDAEQYDEADEQLGLVLKVNPHQPEALANRAVLAHLRNDPAAEQESRAGALQFWRTNPEVDYLIGSKLARKYRFEEAAAAQRRALDFDAAYLPARRELAQDLLRLGQDEEGWKLAQAAYAQDGYDVTLYNLVTLHDQMAKFQTLSNADFTVHMWPREAALYGERVLKLLERAKETLCRKYGVELTRRTTVEIFPEQKDFAVRTFGMPDNPGYLGVCFGSVVTANSPASQAPNPANWEDVLWHEFCHVVTLTDTKNRMPRWLSEGISVYEERQADPTWGERMNLAYRELILKGELTPLGELSSAFLTPKNHQSLQFAYYESSLVVEFLVQRYGLESLKEILKDLRDGGQINKAISAHTAPLDELEKQFSAFARDKAAQLAPEADLEKPPTDDSATDEIQIAAPATPRVLRIGTDWEQSHPHNYYRVLRQARGFMDSKSWTNAKPLLESLVRMYHGESRADNPLWLLAVSERNLKQTNAELAALQEFAEQESDFAQLYVRLVELCQAREDWPAVMKYAQRLLAINPLISTPYDALAGAGVAVGQNEQAIDAYRKVLLLDPPDPSQVHFQLARLLHARGDADSEAKRQVLQALEEAPRFRDAQRLLLDIEGAKSPERPPQSHS
jgi:tetratricopeptide (TPR) repeat protein